MRVAIQSNVWASKLHSQNLPAVLEEVARSQYDGIEIGAHKLNLDDPEGFKSLTARYGLIVAGIHTHGEIFTPAAMQARKEFFEKSASFARQVQSSCVLVSGKPKESKTEIELHTEVDSLHWVADICEAEGMPLYYHTHNWELAGNLRELRFLMAHTDPEKISLALDIGWIQRAGYNPLDVIAEFYPRIQYFHFKDTVGDRWTEIGSGTLDFTAVLEDLNRRGFTGWLTVERDEELENAFESARTSREALRGLGV